MADDDIQVPVDLPVAGTSAPETSEPLAKPDKESPSTGTETTAEDTAPAETEAKAEKPAEEEPTEDKPEEPKKSPWFVERIARQREELARERQQREELAARLKAFEEAQQKPPDQQQQRIPTQAEIQRYVQEEAARLAERHTLQQKLSSFDSKGRGEFPDFVERCNTLASLGAAESPVFMRAITSMEDGHQVVARLAENPQKAMEILSLHPTDMAVALARYAYQAPPAPKPPPVSRAPAPVRPVHGSAHVDADPSKLSDQEWFRKWQEKEGAKA